VDGGSTDETEKEVLKFGEFINRFICERDTGQSQAINKGIKHSTGEILTWINSDDLLCSNALNFVSKFFLDNPGVDLVHGTSLLFGENQREFTIGSKANYELSDYLSIIPFPQSSMFFRRSVLDSIGILDENLKYSMDYDLLLRSMLLGKEIRHVPNLLSRYRIHDKSKSNAFENFIPEWSSLFTKFLNSFEGSDLELEAMRMAGLVSDSAGKYPTSILLDDHTKRQALSKHLEVISHTLYGTGNHRHARKVARALKTYDRIYFFKSGINSLVRRSYVPAWLKQFAKGLRVS
jgi:glycosyltransferase involved in cell wall biosynthesis